MKPKPPGHPLTRKKLGRKSVVIRNTKYGRKFLVKSMGTKFGKKMKMRQRLLAKLDHSSSSSTSENHFDITEDSNIPANSVSLYEQSKTGDSDSSEEFGSDSLSVTRKSSVSSPESPNLTLMGFLNSGDTVGRNLNSTELNVSSLESESESDSADIKEIKNFWLFKSEQCDTAVLVLHHPAQVVLSGSVQIRALCGSANIHGWHLSTDTSEEFEFISVYSTLRYGRHVLCTEAREHLPKRVSLLKHLTARLSSINAELFTSSVLAIATPESVVVAINKADMIWPVEFAVRTLTPSIFLPGPGPFMCKSLGFSICQELKGALVVTQEHRKIAKQICHAIQYARSIGSPAPRIVVSGDRDTGKSTFMRFLINCVLSSGSSGSVYHLDGDPGQSEFAPSSCVALTCVDTPLLGPPFTHQKTPLRQCFVGGTSVEDSPGVYSECFASLVSYYNENFSTEPLFVNTMGWSRGLGLSLLVDVLRFSHPTLVIQMDSSSSVLPILSTEFIREGCGWISASSQGHTDTDFRRVVAVPNVDDPQKEPLGLAAPLQRQLSILTYLGRILSSSTQLDLLKVQPKCVPFNEVSVLLSSKLSVNQENLLQVINGSWVALCFVPVSEVSRPDSMMPNVMKLSRNFCIGFGVIRGIDLDQKVILVLTPEPLFKLQAVNAIAVVGDSPPVQVYSSQNAEGPLPFIKETAVNSKTGFGVKVKQTRRNL